MKGKIKLLLSTAPFLGLTTIMTSCGPSQFDQWVQKYQKKYNDWYPLLTNDENWDWNTETGENCNTEAQAIMMYSYGGGWDTWNTRLHHYGLSEKEIPDSELDTFDDQTLDLPIQTGNQPWEKRWRKEHVKIKVGLYKQVQSGLDKSTCSPVTTFSGSEYNQEELYSQINKLLGHDDWDVESWKNNDPSLYRAIDPTQLVGREITNWGFMSTSLSKSHAWKFLSNVYSGEFKNVVFYEIDVDENTKGGYISNNEHLFAGKQLNWTWEYQLLLQRKMKMTITNAFWTNTSEGKNVLYIKCKGSN